MSDWIIERMSRVHDRSTFDCGNPLLNEWLRQRAGQYERKDLARTYVAVRPGETSVMGYYAISNHRVQFESLPDDQAKGLPRIDVPVVLLGRLAVNRSAQGCGLGAFLLIDALRRVQYIAEQIGIRAIEVDAVDDAARRFYVKFGFTSLRDDPNHLFLPMPVVRRLGLPPLGTNE